MAISLDDPRVEILARILERTCYSGGVNPTWPILARSVMQQLDRAGIHLSWPPEPPALRPDGDPVDEMGG